MSFFKRTIASFGIGAAKVDTKITNNVVKQGDDLSGVVVVKGGDTNQPIESIKLNLMTLYCHEGNDRLTSAIIHTHKVNEPFIINEQEQQEIPFSFKIPLDTPMTMEDPKTFQNVPPVWIETGVEIKNAVDPKDKDPITVDPTEVYEGMIDLIKMVGFRFRQMENQRTPRVIKSRLPYVQQFEFVPNFGKYAHKLDELEVYMMPEEHETKLYFEIDKKTRGTMGSFAEKMNLDQHHGVVTFKNDTILNDRNAVCDKIEEIIDGVL